MDLQKIKEEHLEKRSLAELFRETLVEQIGIVLSQDDITLGVPIESRVKDFESIFNKGERKSLDIDSILQLDDFIGVRVILLFKRDIEKVENSLRGKFLVVKSEDKSQALEEDKFGYQSHHHIIEFPDSWLNVPSFSNFKGFKAEVQVRTLSQHIWAATSHKLQYKKEHNVPLPLKRAINRASALLEVVDLEFERVLIEREGYVKTISDQSKLDDQRVLDIDIIKVIAEKELPKENRVEEEDFNDILSELLLNGINTVGVFRSNLEKGLPEALRKDAEEALSRSKSYDQGIVYSSQDIERALKGVFYSHVGLIRISMVNALRGKYKIKAGG